MNVILVYYGGRKTSPYIVQTIYSNLLFLKLGKDRFLSEIERSIASHSIYNNFLTIKH